LETVAAYAVAIIGLGVLILLHEAGHFFVARWSGMKVSKFSIGFGPSLAKIESGGTVYQIGAIPLGGFVAIDGMNPHDGSDPNAPSSYRNKPFHLRFATILAGPVANYGIGFVLLFTFFALFNYEPLPPIRVSDVASGSPAAAAGLTRGDLITGTSSRAFAAVSDLFDAIQANGGGPVVLRVERGDRAELVTITPKRVGGDRFIIGIAFEAAHRVDRPLGASESVVRAAGQLWPVSKALLFAFVSLIRRDGSVEVSGPIGMVRGLSERVSESWTDAIGDIARISIMLGFFNLLPIPGLDGSRLMFLAFAMIRRREVQPKIETIIHATGILLLLGMMVVVSIGDLLE
jgi:regulator of sigma E protease